MCGIVGYVGYRKTGPILMDALRRLEYRGYDSCGLAVVDHGTAHVVRAAGPMDALDAKIARNGNDFMSASPGQCGIGHTRWATHGKPTEGNAHPHGDCTGKILVAHNGIIENHGELKTRLTRLGHRFDSETDTEILPHLIEHYFSGVLDEAVRAALEDVEGAYGIVVVSSHDPGKIVVARNGAPLVLGLGRNENFVASDAPALLPHTRDMVFLEDEELAVLRSGSVDLTDLAGNPVRRSAHRVTWSSEVAEKNGYPHFMLKEIFEQPRAIRDSLRGRVRENGRVALEHELGDFSEVLRRAQRIEIVACGTSLHAGMVAKFMIEDLARIPVDIDIASEFRYRRRPFAPGTVVLGISQSGETADTLAGLKQAGSQGVPLLTICNVVGSSMTRLCDGVLHTHAGPEIGVASTKSFTTQLTVSYLLALHLAQQRATLSESEVAARTRELADLPLQLDAILNQDFELQSLAERFHDRSSFLYLGRGLNHPIALEGALKLKEISYIHAEGFPSGELKHGPIALISDEMPVFFIVPRDDVFIKSMGNLEEVKSRGGVVIAIATDGDDTVQAKADHTLFLPPMDPLLYPVAATIYLQLFAYHAACLLGRNVDRPRNLAKSVTVE